jgi:hypothetical protein
MAGAAVGSSVLEEGEEALEVLPRKVDVEMRCAMTRYERSR